MAHDNFYKPISEYEMRKNGNREQSKTLLRKFTSFTACFKPNKTADNEELDEQRKFRPQARPLVSETCSKMLFPNCLTVWIR